MSTPATSPRPARARFFTGLLPGFVLGAGGCWGWGWFSTKYHVIEESKLCYSALTDHAAKLQPQTREYLKARLYSNAATWVSPSWMEGWAINFGPVDDAALGGLDPIKDAETTSTVYQVAMRKHGLRPISR